MPTDAADSTDEFRFAADWGPWSGGAPTAQTRHDITLLYALSSVIVGRQHPLTAALSRADMAPDDARGMLAEALAEAGLELERLPALRRRNLLSSYQNCVRKYPDAARPRTKQGLADQGHYAKAERKGAAA